MSRLSRFLRSARSRWRARRVWNQALADPTFVRALNEGLADVEAGRVIPWSSSQARTSSSFLDRLSQPAIAQFAASPPGTAVKEAPVPADTVRVYTPPSDATYSRTEAIEPRSATPGGASR